MPSEMARSTRRGGTADEMHDTLTRSHTPSICGGSSEEMGHIQAAGSLIHSVIPVVTLLGSPIGGLRDTNPRYHALLSAFKARTGCPVLVNTSFNVRGEPIVCTPDDAYLCFMRTHMDVLVLGNQILLKQEQPEFHEDFDWRERYALD